MEAEGSCNCGSVKFAVDTVVSDVYICHCSICRKSTGSGGIAVAIVDNNDFSWVEGKRFIKSWQKPNHDWHTNFCKKCGSSLPGRNDKTNTYVPVGLLNSGYDDLKVVHHLFVGSKAPWEEFKDNGALHQNGFCANE